MGLDVGSTTIKAVVIDSQDRIVFTHYASNEGDPVAAAVDIVRAVRSALPEGCEIGRSCATGYGEGLVKAALTMDEGEIETMAHYRAAEFICPGVTSGLRLLPADLRADDGHRRAVLRAHGYGVRVPRGSGHPLHGVHELLR